MLKRVSFVAALFCYSLFAMGAPHWDDVIRIDPHVLKAAGGRDGLRKRFEMYARQAWGQELQLAPNEDYPADVLKEVDEIVNAGISVDGLTDLTAIPFVTIDNNDSRDLDQALAIEKKDDGNYIIHYAIADASYFIRPGSALDKWAQKRIFTTYLPESALPVLPRSLSEDLCSLNPGKERRAIVVSTTLDKTGQTIAYDFHHALIKSRAQLTYQGVQEFFDEAKSLGLDDLALKSVELMREVGELLVEGAKKRGYIALSDAELRVLPNTDETLAVGLYKGRYTVEAWNEQISVLANSVVAEFIDNNGYKSLHRYHPRTWDRKYDCLRQTTKQLHVPWEEGQSLQDYVAALGDESDVNLAIRTAVCLTRQRAVYSVQYHGHNALELKNYDHFTAPMRRYTDVLVHRILLAIRENRSVPYQENDGGFESLEVMETVASNANRARMREGRIVKYSEAVLAELALRNKVNETFDGVILKFGNNGGGFETKLVGHPFNVWVSTPKKGKSRKGRSRRGKSLHVGQRVSVRYTGKTAEGKPNFELVHSAKSTQK